MKVRTKLINILEKNAPTSYYGSITDYPDEYITFSIDDIEELTSYDNVVVAYEWEISVNYFNKDILKLYSKMDEIVKDLKNAGFIPQGKPIEVISNDQAHRGLTIDFLYIER